MPLDPISLATVRWTLLYHVVRIDKTSNLSLFNLRFLSESRMHVPQVQYTMPVVQHVEQLWHCTLEVISRISKHSVFPMMRIMSFGWMG